jgi:hypothetical protein
MNPVIGNNALEDAGVKFSAAGKGSMSEIDKIHCHLSFALREVKNSNNAISSAIGVQSQHRRTKLLSILERYIASRRFPKHEDDNAINERKPCFVDSSDTPCAVAHLMRESGADGQLLASAIATSHKHHTIEQILQDIELCNKIKFWTDKFGFQPSELALIQPTYEFVAESCRRMFNDILSEIKSAVSSLTTLTTTEKHGLARKMVIFGDEMVSGFGYPLADIPKYLAELDSLLSLEMPDDKQDITALVAILRKEVQGAGTRHPRTEPEDYLGYLSEEDLDYWKKSGCSNRRVPRGSHYY